MNEIHLFIGEGTIGKGNALGFAPGGRHRVIVFVRQEPGAAHDFAAATKRAEEYGLLNVDLREGATFQPDTLGTVPAHLVAAYQRAMSLGTGIIVYSQGGDPRSAEPVARA